MSAPKHLFEVSWEVCNMVGGIHTVIASKVPNMLATYGDGYVTVGPDVARLEGSTPVFREEVWDEGWLAALGDMEIGVRMGRWLVPGEPRCLLVDHSRLHGHKDGILARYWESFALDSLFGHWDYYDPVLFGHAVGRVVERLVAAGRLSITEGVVVHAHEWLTGGTVLHLCDAVPWVGTVFTTHATTLGRALGARDLDDPRPGQTADAAARELGVMAKHSMEVVTAREADVFTTVSSLTADECDRLLGRAPERLLRNGLDDEFPPALGPVAEVAARGRAALLRLAERATGTAYDDAHTDILVSAGRYEYHNKGIDLFLDLAAALEQASPGEDADGTAGAQAHPTRRVIAFALFPAAHAGPRRELLHAEGEAPPHPPLLYTHTLRHPERDPVLERAAQLGLDNQPERRVHVIFVPIYLDGNDPLLPQTYYELAAGADLTIFPSRYEPWGYTPMESLGLAVPTVTSDHTGFGRWVADRGDTEATGACVLARKDVPDADALAQLVAWTRAYLARDAHARRDAEERALATSHACRWEHFGAAYLEVHQTACNRAANRMRGAASRPAAAVPPGESMGQGRRLRRVVVRAALPEALAGLERLAGNLRWSWRPETEALLAELDPQAWRASGRNPITFLGRVSATRLAEVAARSDYGERLATELATLDEMEAAAGPPSIAYFCMEYGLLDALEIYSGGLGVLAGDHLKAASDAKLPLCAVGMAWHEGYFRQRIRPDGSQEARPEHLDWRALPVTPLRNSEGRRIEVTVPFPGGPLRLRAWQVQVGAVALYLLDSNVPGNRDEDRSITARLYGGSQRDRLRQEMVLGVGGLELLRALGITPSVFHMNEGHSAFLGLARAVHLVRDHAISADEAMAIVRRTSVFTTHTPVAAGHDVFPADLVRPYLTPFAEALSRDADAVLSLGARPATPGDDFSMTRLAVRGSSRVNGVSQIHARVSRPILAELYPGLLQAETPVTPITNGIHVPTWATPEWQSLFARHVGEDWQAKLRDPEAWAPLRDAPPAEAWQAHRQARGRLLDWLREHVRTTWLARREDPATLEAALAGLEDERAILVGFARRFAPYKRATLLLDDLHSLAELLDGDPPIVLVFAGKAHPSDHHGAQLLRKIVEAGRHPGLQGKVLFVEDYGLASARLLVSGCDVWLNTPTRPLEASGTSGMKAAVNGVPNVSVGDGWWAEGYNGRNGWIIGAELEAAEDAGYQNALDRAALRNILAHELRPMLAERDADGVPVAWTRMMLESIASTAPRFSAARMVGDYADRAYGPALSDARRLSENGFQHLFDVVRRYEALSGAWEHVTVEALRVRGVARGVAEAGRDIEVRVSVAHPGLAREDLRVELVWAPDGEAGGAGKVFAYPMQPQGEGSEWAVSMAPSSAGTFAYGVRVRPADDEVAAVHPIREPIRWLG